MSVIKNKRGLSKLEFYHNARKMRREITMLVLRDFGIHSRGKKFKEDTGSRQPEEFYDELIAEFSKNIRLLLRNMMWNITAGNTIYPVNDAELQERRLYQDRAIIACEQLLQEMLYYEDVLPVKASKMLSYVEHIEFEIKLLKGWRKANSKIEERITGRKQKKKGGNEKSNQTAKRFRAFSETLVLRPISVIVTTMVMPTIIQRVVWVAAPPIP
jgi:hypothetical protein